MKKCFMYFVMLLTMAFGASVTVSAQSKAVQKDAKKRVKELKKEGWTLLGSTSTLEFALTKYRNYIAEDEENRIELIGIAVGSNPKIGRENAIMNGITSYASRAKAQVVGKMKSVMSSDASTAMDEEIDKFGAAYESGVNTKISGLVKQHFVLVRDKDGKKEFNVFMSIDEKLAKKAREEAAREARKKAALKDLSEQVEDFVGEPVEEY